MSEQRARPEEWLGVRRQEMDGAYDATVHFLDEHPDKARGIVDCLAASEEMEKMLPENVSTVFRGYSLPIVEARLDLQASVGIAFRGQYKQAVATLRSFLEMGILSTFFTPEDLDELEGWAKASNGTPWRKAIVGRLKQVSGWSDLNQATNFEGRLAKIWDSLNDSAHTNGARQSSFYAYSRSTVPLFSEHTFNRWLLLFKEAVSLVAEAMLLRHPLGLKPLPVHRKFGVNRPIGWFLEEEEVQRIERILSPEALSVLRKIRDECPDVLWAIQHFQELPDLTEMAGDLIQLSYDIDFARVHLNGLEGWMQSHRGIYQAFTDSERANLEARITVLKKWVGLTERELEEEKAEVVKKFNSVGEYADSLI